MSTKRDARRRNRKPRSDERLAQIKEETGQVLDLLPVVGDARSIGRAYDAAKAGDWGTAALEGGLTAAGWIPAVGPLARAAKSADLAATAIRHADPEYAKLFGREVLGQQGPLAKSAGASALFGKNLDDAEAIASAAAKAGVEPKVMRDSFEAAKRNANNVAKAGKKNPRAAKKVKQYRETLGDDWKDVLVDMDLEAQYPEIAEGTQFPGLSKIKDRAEGHAGQRHPRWYRPYEHPSGQTVHSLYGDVQARPGFEKPLPHTATNIMGGVDQAPLMRRGEAPTVGGDTRITPGNFTLVGDIGDPKAVMAADRITPEMYAPIGGGGPLADPRIAKLKGMGYSDAQIANVLKATQ